MPEKKTATKRKAPTKKAQAAKAVAAKKTARKIAKGEKESMATHLKHNPTSRMLKAGFAGDVDRLSKDAVTEAATRTEAFVHKVAQGAYERMGKTQTLMVQGGRNPLHQTLDAMSVPLDVDRICSSTRIAKTHGKKNKEGKVVRRSDGVGLATAHKLFAGKRRISADMEVQVANLIDAYVQKLGDFASRVAANCGKKTVQSKDIALAASLMRE